MDWAITVGFYLGLGLVIMTPHTQGKSWLTKIAAPILWFPLIAWAAGVDIRQKWRAR